MSILLLLPHTYFRHQLCNVAEGLHFLHLRNVVHSDFKGVCDCFKPLFTTVLTRAQSSILLDADKRACITDFGLTMAIQHLDSIRSASDDQGHIGQLTLPEILNDEGTYSNETDIFSLAMVMVEAPYKCIICIELWLTAISHHHRHLPARLHSIAAYTQRLC
jgi:serine/threonine protein kinase